MKIIFLVAFLFINVVFSAPKCEKIKGEKGMWIKVNGKKYPCATTTRYWDGFKGACGCGTGTGNGKPFPWQWNTLTAAASDSLFGKKDWCGPGCGDCYSVTPTGGFIDGQGSAPKNIKSRLLMVTNMCPAKDNKQWCTSPNKYGYTAHFDLMDHNMKGIITDMGWNNVEVYYEKVPCPVARVNQWKECECHK